MTDLKLPDDFVARYATHTVPWDTVGYLTYKRTYSRAVIPDKYKHIRGLRAQQEALRQDTGNPSSDFRTEEWHETAQRCVNWYLRAAKGAVTVQEGMDLYDDMMNLRSTFSGRALWQAGTETVERLGNASLANCYCVAINSIESFSFVFDMLMLGGGVGFNIQKKYVFALPEVKGAKVFHRDTQDADYILPDKREGWVELLSRVLEAYFNTGGSFSFSTVCVRPAGSPINAFGGVASGPGPLCEGIKKICAILDSRVGAKLRPIDCLDILNIIGSIVVAGNVRRCLPGEAEVMTDRGLVRIDEIKEGDLVWSCKLNQYRPVSKVFVQGEQDLVKVVMLSGKEFECTGNHRVAVFTTATDYEWRMAKDVLPGESLVRLTADPRNVPDAYKTMNPYLYFPDAVKYVVEGRKSVPTYDIEVEEAHEFFANMLLVHNSAEIALGDTEDTYFLMAKRFDLMGKDDGNGGVHPSVPNHRAMSNNSVICNNINHLPQAFWDTYEVAGEPYGLVNLKLAKKMGRLGERVEEPKLVGVNPCGEIPLESYGFCNLAEIFLPNISSVAQLVGVASRVFKVCKVVASLGHHWEEADRVMQESMRTGVGITGVLQHGFGDGLKDALDTTYKALRRVDDEFTPVLSQAIGRPLNRSVKITTVKPSGSLSLLANVSPGLHPAFAKYYIRRIRMSSSSALVRACAAAGYHVEPNLRYDGTVDPDTSVVSFPQRSRDGSVVAADMTAIDQLETLKLAQGSWSDNSVSITCYYHKSELPAIREWLRKNYNDHVKSVSFCQHSEHGFVQAPMEEITEQQYLEMSRNLSAVVLHDAVEEELTDSQCATGACPIR